VLGFEVVYKPKEELSCFWGLERTGGDIGYFPAVGITGSIICDLYYGIVEQEF